jgi:hypothetical protein
MTREAPFPQEKTLVPQASRSRSGPCARCRHPYALHSNGTTACRAFACTAGPEGGPCQEFLAQAMPVAS